MTTTVTMTTLEIALLTGKRHDNVLRDARVIIAQVTALKTEECSDPHQTLEYSESTYRDGRNAERTMLILGKHLTFTLITGYDTRLRHNVVGRWIELEAQANPGFLQETVTETLNTLQARINDMAPAFDEYVRKGRSAGYTWREACRLAGIEHPDKVMAMLVDKGLAKVSGKFTELHPKYVKRGHVKVINKRNKAIQLTGHLFKITLDGLNVWLRPNAKQIAEALHEHQRIKLVVDSEGFPARITGEGSQRLTLWHLTPQQLANPVRLPA